MNRRTRQWIGYVIMVIGLAFLAGPFVVGYFTGKGQARIVSQYEDELGQEDSANSDRTGENLVSDKKDTSSRKKSKTEKEKERFYKDAVAYNKSLVEGGQDNMNTSEDVESFALDARDYGFSENMIGTIEIPRLDEKLGIYLGANYDGMDKGVAIFGMTSLPLGLGDENVAIAGHRGWRGTPVFRDIQLIQVHDPIYVTTPWRTLVYRVTGMEIVTPDDNSWCKVQKGKTMISLMTCHPYGDNYHRYIVFAELTDEKKPSNADITKMNRDTFDKNARQVTFRESDGTTYTVDVDAESIEPDGREYGAFWSNVKILAEKRLKPVAIVAAVAVFAIGIWLLCVTIRDRRRYKRHTRDIQGKEI